jgi:hypothetical protein
MKEMEKDWMEEMKAGMRMIKSACNKNNESCEGCPFNKYCTLFEYDLNLCPSDWKIKEEE